MATKGLNATNLDMGKIKDALAGGLGVPSIAAKFQYSASSVSKAVRRLRGAPKAREVGAGRKSAEDKREELEATISGDSIKSAPQNREKRR